MSTTSSTPSMPSTPPTRSNTPTTRSNTPTTPPIYPNSRRRESNTPTPTPSPDLVEARKEARKKYGAIEPIQNHDPEPCCSDCTQQGWCGKVLCRQAKCSPCMPFALDDDGNLTVSSTAPVKCRKKALPQIVDMSMRRAPLGMGERPPTPPGARLPRPRTPVRGYGSKPKTKKRRKTEKRTKTKKRRKTKKRTKTKKRRKTKKKTKQRT